MASIEAFADTFLELSDTPASFAGEGGKFAQVNATPDAIEFFDLFGSANLWTGTNRFNADVTHAAGVLAAADDAYDIGASSERFREFRAIRGTFTSGAGVPTFAADKPGMISGSMYGPGTLALDMGGSAYPSQTPLMLAGNLVTYQINHVATMMNDGGGSGLFGAAGVFQNNTVKTAEILVGPASYGSFTGGFASAFGNTAGATAKILNYGAGSFLWANVGKSNTGTHLATVTAAGLGGFCQGYVFGATAGSHTLRVGGKGAFAQGYVGGSGSSLIESLASGAIAQGFANNGSSIRATAGGAFAQGSAAGGATIEASGVGALARGFALNYDITASGQGSLALGDSSIGPIVASAAGSGQIGPGTNTVAGSLQIFDAVRIRANGQVNFQQDSYGATFGASNDAEIFLTAAGALVIDPDRLSEGSGPVLIGASGDDPLGCDSINDGVGGNFKALTGGQHAGPRETVTLGVGVATFAVGSNSIEVTGDGGDNDVTTITGGLAGQLLVLQFVAGGVVTIVNDDTHAANTVDLVGGDFVGADDSILFLFFDGTSWYQISNAVN